MQYELNGTAEVEKGKEKTKTNETNKIINAVQGLKLTLKGTTLDLSLENKQKVYKKIS